jgi:hypothetical protein
LRKTLTLLESHVQADQAAGSLRKDVDSAALATLLLVLEAGTELLLDFELTLDVEGATRGLAALPRVPESTVARRLTRQVQGVGRSPIFASFCGPLSFSEHRAARRATVL